ncbi:MULTISPECIES: siderophore ferric iron reductase [Vibrio]|uniref:siderophore ferric iron reductase n=1 Tax=Vibrio TaxID=662 RepID=UPI00030C5C9A|nr:MULTISPECIES: siderophore ferric iron reductase [Vibrio]MCZ4307508.1 siderophore ferric iron reductase [Vibrio atlanticus]OEF79097.1 siderophore ferric iron reductase [Vibrio tasmaniensis 1F-155]PMO86881.1 siderophore ferric iron reductase [Vibrio tasmaniensis]
MLPQLHNIITRRKAPSLHQKIFAYSKQVSPYLSGSFGAHNNKSIAVTNENSHKELKRVYDGLSQSHPEAGKAYWLTRTWDLVCWQPIYVTFISIYGLHSLPDIKNIGQFRYKEFITGYRFFNGDHQHGSPEELIPDAGEAILALTEFYRSQISEWTRIRPGFTNHLLADLLLGSLIKLQQHEPSLTNDYIIAQAKLWLEACQLSENHLDSLKVDSSSGMLKLIRISCCLVYKCDSRKYCDNCPRHPDNKKIA